MLTSEKVIEINQLLANGTEAHINKRASNDDSLLQYYFANTSYSPTLQPSHEVYTSCAKFDTHPHRLDSDFVNGLISLLDSTLMNAYASLTHRKFTTITCEELKNRNDLFCLMSGTTLGTLLRSGELFYKNTQNSEELPYERSYFTNNNLQHIPILRNDNVPEGIFFVEKCNRIAPIQLVTPGSDVAASCQAAGYTIWGKKEDEELLPFVFVVDLSPNLYKLENKMLGLYCNKEIDDKVLELVNNGKTYCYRQHCWNGSPCQIDCDNPTAMRAFWDDFWDEYGEE